MTDAYLRYGAVGLGGGWTGSAVYRSDDGGANYALMQTLAAQASIGAVLMRTITGLTSPATIYTTAQQVADFGAAQSSVTINVYQLSAAVGRGYAGVAAI